MPGLSASRFKGLTLRAGQADSVMSQKSFFIVKKHIDSIHSAFILEYRINIQKYKMIKPAFRLNLCTKSLESWSNHEFSTLLSLLILSRYHGT